MLNSDKYNYWTGLAEFEFGCQIEQLDIPNLQIYETSNLEGVIAYVTTHYIVDKNYISVAFIYVKPEHRKNYRIFRELLSHVENKAKEVGEICIGSSFAYRDDKMLRLLIKRGYKIASVRKVF